MVRPQTPQLKLFIKYKKELIKKLGKKALYDDIITREATKILGNKYLGTFSQDTVPIKPGYAIMNVDTLDEDGSHWIGLYMTAKTIYIYDSYGRHSEKLLPILEKQINKKKLNSIDSCHLAEQFGYKSEICGHLSLAFLCVVKELGIRKALTI